MKLKLIAILCITFMLSVEAFAHDVFNPYMLRKNEIVFSQNLHSIDGLDPTISSNTKGSYYPGVRGANQLIVYTPAYGRKTNTNEYGTEAVVVNGTVVAISGADSLIPANGLVISGHGTAKIWINENLIVGTKISIDTEKKILSSYITSDSFLFGAKSKLHEVSNIMNFYIQNASNYDYRKTSMYLDRAKKYIAKAEKDSVNVQKYSMLAINNANAALSTVIPYKSDELRGVWIRPEPYSTKQIASILDRLESAGINNIFLETYFHGQTIYPSEVMAKYGFVPQNQDFKGDVLKQWIKLAHDRNIKVNIWFESFYVGNKNPQYYPQSILAKKPTWANVPKRSYNSVTPVPSLSEHNGYFIDPANPEVQTFLLELLTEIVSNYKPDGINLDYVRYPQSIDSKFNGYDLSNWGYTQIARNTFKEKYNYDPINLTVTSPLWECWAKYRQDNITSFVSQVSNLCKSNGLMFTTVIFPDRQTALTTKQQNWKQWVDNGYVDGLTPLLLTCDAKTSAGLMEEVLRCVNHNTKVYSGLFVTFMNGAPEDLLRQIHESRKLNINGVILFDYAHFDNKYLNVLKLSAFKRGRSRNG